MAKLTSTVTQWMDDQLAQDPALRARVEQRMQELKLEEDLVALRQARGLTQAQVARLLGVSQPVVARWEAGGANLELRTLVRWVTALGGSLDVAVKPIPTMRVVGIRTAAQRYRAGRGSQPRVSRTRG